MIDINAALASLNSRYEEIFDLIPDPYFFSDESDCTITNDPNYGGLGYADVVFFQNDGKVLYGGNSNLEETDSEGGYSVVKRFDTNGTLDSTFTSPKFTGGNPYVRDFGQQSDGKLVVVGHFNEVDGTTVNRIVRLNTDGSVDNSFSSGTGFSAQVFGIKVLSDDSMLCYGNFSEFNGLSRPYFVKLNSDGSDDSTFSSSLGLDGNVHMATVDSAGKIYIGGNFTNRIQRLNSDGSTDTTFDVGSGFNSRVTDIKIQSDGKILVGGWFNQYKGVDCNPGIVRLETNGDLDSTFVTEGTGLDLAGNGVQTVCLQSDGKILLGGWFTGYNGAEQNRIIRLNANGTKDSSFVIGTGFEERVQNIKVDSSGNVHCAGFFEYYNEIRLNIVEFNFGGTVGFGSARLNSTGTLLGTTFTPNFKYCGIDDGGDDMYDGANYLNTNLTQLYDNIKTDDGSCTLSIPITHTPYSTNGEDAEGEYYNPPMDGVVVDGTDYFGTGSQYFTNMYPAMFVMIANNVSVNEFSISGNLGSDGSGTDAVAIFPITAGGYSYTAFYKSNYDGGDPSVNHIIIVPGNATGITQEYDDEGEYDDHCLKGITGRDEIYFINIARIEDLQLSVEDATLIAQKFMEIVWAAPPSPTPQPTDEPTKIPYSYPMVTFEISTIDLIEFTGQLLPDENRNNILNQLLQRTVWIEGWPYALKHGDKFTLYGTEAVRVLNMYNQIKNPDYKLTVLYYGAPKSSPTPTPTISPSPTPSPTLSPSPTPEPTATPIPTETPATSPSPTPTPSPGPFYTTDNILYLDAGDPISYPGNASGPWYDLSTQANDAALSTVTYSAESKGIMNFNGSSSGGTLTASKYDVPYAGKTVFVAAKMSADMSNNSHRALLGDPSPATRDFNLYMNRTAGGDYRLHYSSATYGTYSSNLSVYPGQWFIATVTHATDGTVKYYLNGELVSTTSQTFAQYTGAGGNEYVGRADNYWFGDIAVIGVYKNELTAEQVSQNYFSIINRFENPGMTPLPTMTPALTSAPPTPTPTAAPPGTGGRLPQPSQSLSYNGITLTGSGTGVANFVNPFTNCSVSMPANSMLFGGSGGGSYTVTFSQAVNDIILYGAGQNAGETFTFSVDNGTLNATLLPGVGCNGVINNNVVSNTGVGSFGATLTSTAPYTSITITFPGGLGGTLFSISEASVVPAENPTPTPTAIPSSGVESFTEVGTTSWTAPLGVTSVEYLVVGGGGGGGNGYDTGGGAGGGSGMVLTGTLSVTPGQSYSVTVGAGGTGGAGARSNNNGTDGGNSVFDSIISLGGGLGRGSRSAPTSVGYRGSSQVGSTTAPTGGDGGGNNLSAAGGSGGGGGGSGGDGTNGASGSGGSGGAGLSSSITGSAITYGAGGNGARGNVLVTGAAGAANTGEGGGGGSCGATCAGAGGNGGSGIVVIAYEI